MLHSYFCQEVHLCQFQFWKKMLWGWRDVTNMNVTNMPTCSQSILSKLGKICQNLTVENVHVVNHGVRDAVRLTWTWKHMEARWVRGHGPPWNFEIWAPWMAENVLEILHSLCFRYLKAPSPDFQRFKSLDPPPLLQNFIDDPPLWSPSPPPPPPPPMNSDARVGWSRTNLHPYPPCHSFVSLPKGWGVRRSLLSPPLHQHPGGHPHVQSYLETSESKD